MVISVRCFSLVEWEEAQRILVKGTVKIRFQI